MLAEVVADVAAWCGILGGAATFLWAGSIFVSAVLGNIKVRRERERNQRRRTARHVEKDPPFIEVYSEAGAIAYLAAYHRKRDKAFQAPGGSVSSERVLLLNRVRGVWVLAAISLVGLIVLLLSADALV